MPFSSLNLKFHHLFFILVACFAFWAGPVRAQETPVETAPLAETASNPQFSAPVIIDGEELFVVRGSSALPANERAEMVAGRIIEIAENDRVLSIEMRIDNGPLGKSILANGRLITITTQADGELDQMDLDVLSQLQSDAIENAIFTYRAARSDDGRVDSFLEALIWTAVFLVTVVLMVTFRNHLPDRVAAYVTKRTLGVGGATNNMVNSAALGRLVRYVLRLVLLIILLFAIYFYLSMVLLAFAETKPVALLLMTYVTGPILSVLGGFISYLPNLITIAIIVALTRLIIKGVRLFFENVEAGTIRLKDFEPNWIWPTFNIFRVAIVMIAIVFSFPHIPGSDSQAFQGLAILAGLTVSLGSNSVIANGLSGLFVIYRRSTNIGDRIKIGNHVGDVVQIKLMETHIKSIKNELLSTWKTEPIL